MYVDAGSIEQVPTNLGQTRSTSSPVSVRRSMAPAPRCRRRRPSTRSARPQTATSESRRPMFASSRSERCRGRSQEDHRIRGNPAEWTARDRLDGHRTRTERDSPDITAANGWQIADLNPPSMNVEYGFRSRPGHSYVGVMSISATARSACRGQMITN